MIKIESSPNTKPFTIPFNSKIIEVANITENMFAINAGI
jgi:hypothetical protein